MEESSHDQQNEKLDHECGSLTICQGSNINSPKHKANVIGGGKKCLQEPSQNNRDFQIQDNLRIADFNRQSLYGVSLESNASKADTINATANVEYDDDDKDVAVRELRNGCDKTLDQKQDIFILPDQLKNISLSQTSLDEISKENVSEMSSTNTKDSFNLTQSMSTHGSICTYPCSPTSAGVPLAAHNTTQARYTDEKGLEKGIKEQVHNLRLDKNATDLCAKAAIRGKSIAQPITNNLSTEAVNVPNPYVYSAATNNQMALKYACQSPYITVLPLLACNTFNHSHCNHLHIHYHQNHNNQSESENYSYANELTNALSSRVLFQITNNSSYCTNSASKSHVKRQCSFLKSQSLEIMQDSPTIIYHEIDDDDQQLFFQLPEFDKGGPSRSHHENSYHSKYHRQNGPQQSNMEDEPGTLTGTQNDTDTSEHESLMITRLLSLSSKKTGVALKTQSLESRPIYPNVPYSPYASPYSSPRSNRRRPPLRESRRVSIEQSGSFLQLNQYKLMDQIGQGSYGLVKLAYSEEDSTHYAMKILSKRRLLRQAGLMKRGPKKSTSPLDRVYREIAVLKKLDHPNVVKLIEVLDDPVEDSLYLVFELVKQGEVLSVPTKSPLSEERAWSVFRDTMLGLEYLHYQRIIHGDIKPGNLLLTECGRVKIADLGVCNEFIGEDATMTNGSTAGTPAFRAPESLNVGQNIYCGRAADIWALGATLYALVYGNVPFMASTIPALYEKIKTEELSFPEIPKTSVALKDCIQSMLKKDPADRITLPQLKDHVWVNAGGVYPLPTEEENCRLVQVNDDDINSVVRSIPKLDTLILIKTMLKKHSFGNPFSRGISGRAPQRGGSRFERFIRAGRSNSAPGSYNMIVDRQPSADNILPALCEHSPTSSTSEECQ